MKYSMLGGRVVLVVENEPLLALDVLEILRNAGAHAVLASKVSDAIDLADHSQISAAVLDIGLDDDDCQLICAHLRERDVPFLFYTGYPAGLSGWEDVTVLKKPARAEEILEAVARLYSSRPQETAD